MNPFKTAFEEVLRSEKVKEQNDNQPTTYLMVATLEVILNGKGTQVRSQEIQSTLHLTLPSLQLSAFSPLALASGLSKLGGETVSPR